jgi:tetratricopeptide (TPR) repeat protein
VKVKAGYMVVKVHVWEPEADSSLGSALTLQRVGHAAIQIGTIYVSFYPSKACAVVLEVLDIKPEVFGLENYKLQACWEDLVTKGKPDHTIELQQLNEEAMLQKWSRIKAYARYHPISNNCSSIVYQLLLHGWENRSEESFFEQFADLCSKPIEISFLTLTRVQHENIFSTPKGVYSFASALREWERNLLSSTVAKFLGIATGLYSPPEEKCAYCKNMKLGIDLVKIGRTEEAIVMYDNAIKSDSNHYWAYYNRARGYYDLNRLEEAFADCCLAISLNSEHGSSFHLRACILWCQNRLNEAVIDLKKAIELNPEYSEAYSTLGDILICLGRINEAIDAFNNLIRVDQESGEAYKKRAYAFHAAKSFNAALGDYIHAIQLNQVHWGIFSNIGLIHYESKNTEEAIKYWEIATALDGKAVEPLFARAVALRSGGNMFACGVSVSYILEKDNRFADIEFLKNQYWGARLISDTQKVLKYL